MAQQEQATHAVYNPSRLLDALIERMGLANDGALSRKLNVAKTVIYNIRHGRLAMPGSMLLWMHEATGISIDELRALMGDRRAKLRPAYAIVR
jgi:hypothetical protein